MKPSNLRGIKSQGMVLCAEKDGRVELIQASDACQPGDRVRWALNSTLPPQQQEEAPPSILNPKKKIFEACAVNLKTDATGMPVYLAGKLEGKEEVWRMIVLRSQDQEAFCKILPTSIQNGIVR